MLKNEFEERIGRKVTDEEFVNANAMYMAAGDGTDKDVFCSEWKRIGESPLVKGLFETACRNGKRVQELEEVNEEQLDIISDAADAMLSVSKMQGITAPIREALESKAVWLVGMREVIKRKARMLITYNRDEIAYIEEHLK